MRIPKKFTIVIREIGTEKKMMGEEWQEGAAEDGKGFGYTPKIEKDVPYEATLYMQEFKEIHLEKVVYFLNQEK